MWFSRDCCFLCACLYYPTLIPLRRKSSWLLACVLRVLSKWPPAAGCQGLFGVTRERDALCLIGLGCIHGFVIQKWVLAGPSVAASRALLFFRESPLVLVSDARVFLESPKALCHKRFLKRLIRFMTRGKSVERG